jgi:hypothetical protein
MVILYIYSTYRRMKLMFDERQQRCDSCLSTQMFPSKPRIQNVGSGNGMPQNSTPHTYRVDAGRKDHG